MVGNVREQMCPECVRMRNEACGRDGNGDGDKGEGRTRERELQSDERADLDIERDMRREEALARLEEGSRLGAVAQPPVVDGGGGAGASGPAVQNETFEEEVKRRVRASVMRFLEARTRERDRCGMGRAGVSEEAGTPLGTHAAHP